MSCAPSSRRDRAPTSVAIVGAGIGGMAAALFLGRAGIPVEVYEQAPALGAVGAGIQLGPNAVRLLHLVGLADRLRADGVRPRVAWDFRRWRSGEVLFQQAFGDAEAEVFGAPYYLLHRADLLDGLCERIPAERLHLGHRCVDVVERAGGGVELVFANGHRGVADVVIGADGIHSAVRERVFAADAEPRFSGLCQYRALVPIDRTPLAGRPASATIWLGPGRHFVHYPVSGGRLLNVVGHVPAGNWRTESWSAAGSVTRFASEFADWHPQVTGIVAEVEHTMRWALYDREPPRRWVSGPIALLGDAAHPMLPFFAQGACQAIEDAAVLAECLRLATGDAPEALRRYEAIRGPRATKVQRISRDRAELYHLPDGAEQRRRDIDLAASDPLHANAWLYDYDLQRELAAVPGPDPRRNPA